MKFLWLSCALLFSSFSAFAEPREEVQLLLQQSSSMTSVIDRMDHFSKGFLGLPYGVSGPLGEGTSGRYDQDPLYRLDTFDCTTFIETVLALAFSSGLDEFEKILNQLRYEKGEVDYLKRNHFPSLQWIPNNIQNGFLQEINSILLPASDRAVAKAMIDIGGWLRKANFDRIQVPVASEVEKQKLLNELISHASDYSPVEATLDYLPISTLLASPVLLKAIPDGTVVSFVRPNWDLTASIGTHMNVSHHGLVFQKNGMAILRHASAGAEKKVVEVSFLEYLSRFENHPTLKGIHLLYPTRQ